MPHRARRCCRLSSILESCAHKVIFWKISNPVESREIRLLENQALIAGLWVAAAAAFNAEEGCSHRRPERLILRARTWPRTNSESLWLASLQSTLVPPEWKPPHFRPWSRKPPSRLDLVFLSSDSAMTPRVHRLSGFPFFSILNIQPTKEVSTLSLGLVVL
jgi:hypothetical protein